jgi:magnesium-protoporphyrin IX monomethyl ester (oxidative) cyclase
MKVILINPPLLSKTKSFFLTQPLGLASIAASLRKEGHEVKIIDSPALGFEKSNTINILGENLFRHGLDYHEIADLIPEDADLVGITAPFTHHSHIIRPLIKAIRERHGNIKIVLGGVYPSTLPIHASKMGADYIAIGEGEPIMVSLARGDSVESITGLYISSFLSKLKSEKDFNREVGLVENLDSLPFPARDLLPFDAYIKSKASGRGKENFGVSIHTSRGCPYGCTFCSVHSVFKRGYRARAALNVWQEMLQIMEKYKVFNFEFEDDNLTLIRERAINLFSKMADWNKNHEQKITFITPNGIRIDTLDKEMLFLMKEAGCKRISLAMEHGDPEMLKLMNKKLSLEKVKEVVRDCKKVGINVFIYFIIGFPGETLAHWKNGIKFARRLKKIDKNILFDVSFAKALPKTPLLDICREKGYLTGANPDEIVLIGNFSNIKTADFSPDDLQKRFEKTIKILNNKSFFRKALAKIKNSLFLLKFFKQYE